MFTIFGVDIRLRDYVRGFFATDESKSITEQLVKMPVIKLFWRTLKLTPRIWRSCRAMNKKWPWTPPQELLDRPLREIRDEFGIVIFRPEVVLGLPVDLPLE